MAYIEISKQHPLVVETCGVAGEDIAAHLFVQKDVDGTIIVADGSGSATVLGVVQVDVKSGDPVSVVREGEAFVIDAAGSLTEQMNITADASGKAVQSGVGDPIAGYIPRQGGAVADDIIVAYIKMNQ